MNVAVLMGGTSTERDVSLSSGTAVAAALREEGHAVATVDVAYGSDSGRNDPNSLFLDLEQTSDDRFDIGTVPPSLSKLARLEYVSRGSVFPPGVLEVCRFADVVFLALHGGEGEDGHVQAALEMAGVPYTGADYLGCALAFNKDISKRLMRASGVLTPDWRVARDSDIFSKSRDDLPQLPCIVKPAKGGSTIGVSLVRSEDELHETINETLRYSGDVLLEEFVGGREFTVGVIGDRVLPVVETQVDGEIFDYESKYQPGAAQEECPAQITEDQTQELQRLSLLAHGSLRLGSRAYSRVDFRLDDSGRPSCLEVNVLPGMTPNSLLPLSASNGGLSFPRLCERIVHLALSSTS